jgi:hypothetical protein
MTILQQASLLMYPSGYKASKLYSINPVDGSGDLDFARSSTGTRVNDSGIVETIAIDTPRLDYLGGGCGKLLIEPQSTNLALNSEPTSPGGFSTQVVFQQTDVFNWNGIYYGDNSIRRISFFPTATTAGLQYTFSIFVKMTDGSVPSVGNTATDDFRIWLSNVTTTGLTITAIGNGIYRCSVYLGAGGTNTNLAIEKQTYNSAKTFEVSGFQLESFEIPTSYIPTSGTTATRTQDISQTTSSNIAAAINGEEGVLFIDFDRLGLDFEDSWMGLYNGAVSSNFRLAILYRKDRIIGYVRVGGSWQAIMQAYGTWTMPRIKVALKWKVNDFALWVNGVERVTDTSGSIFGAGVLDTVNLGDYLTSSNPKFNSKINALAVYNTALSDADLTTLTTL